MPLKRRKFPKPKSVTIGKSHMGALSDLAREVNLTHFQYSGKGLDVENLPETPAELRVVFSRALKDSRLHDHFMKRVDQILRNY